MEPVLFAALVFLGILLVFMSMLMGQQLDPVQARLQQIAVRPRTLEELELQRPIGERTIKPVIQGISRLIGRFYPQNTVRSVGLRLKRAGMEGTSVEFFLGVKGFAAVVGAIAASAIVNLLTGDLAFTLLGISERVEGKELQNFISAIIQADQLGVSMSKVLRIQSEQLRMERRQRAEEKAARAPILIMLPTVGCIFPSLFIVILAPAALSAMSSCGGV